MTTPGPRFTNDNWAAVTGAPDANRGATVSIVGRVFNIEQDQTREAVQLWTDSVHQTGNTVVIFQKAGAPAVKKEDMIRAEGVLDGEFDGKTDSGEVLHLPRVQASKITLLGANGAEPSASASASVSAAAAPASPAASASASGSPSPAPTEAGARTLSPGVYRVSGSEPTGLNIRTGPALNQPKIGVVHDGGFLRVISAPSGAAYVQVSGDGFTGYVALIYLSGPLQSNPALSKLSPK